MDFNIIEKTKGVVIFPFLGRRYEKTKVKFYTLGAETTLAKREYKTKIAGCLLRAIKHVLCGKTLKLSNKFTSRANEKYMPT